MYLLFYVCISLYYFHRLCTVISRVYRIPEYSTLGSPYELYLLPTVLNVAAGKAPMQSSVDEGGIPQKAVDGSSSTSYNPETCTLTTRERRPWWYVNLLEPYMVQLVRLDFGQSCCGEWTP